MGEGQAIKDAVRERYGRAALQVVEGRTSCCGSATEADAGTAQSTCCGAAKEADPITGNLYGVEETTGLPDTAVVASLGCGNPTALADLRAGEVVLDLGSGGGLDVLLSARRVGPTGKAYGLDMTDEMLALARDNQRRAGVENVEFLRGDIEDIPLPDGTVDVIISNCVINLSADKDRVFREAFRVLKPGGRLAVSDIVARGAVPAAVRQSLPLWSGCVAGALEEREYHARLTAAGFEAVDLEPARIYRAGDAQLLLADGGADADAIAAEMDGRFMSAFVRARKPGA
jgi:SAM-dependent methyltransferase